MRWRRGDVAGGEVVPDSARRRAEFQVVQGAVRELPDGFAAGEDEAVGVGLPAVDGCGPFRPDQAAGEVGVPVGGAEVDRAPVVVQKDSCVTVWPWSARVTSNERSSTSVKETVGRSSMDGAIRTASFR